MMRINLTSCILSLALVSVLLSSFVSGNKQTGVIRDLERRIAGKYGEAPFGRRQGGPRNDSASLRYVHSVIDINEVAKVDGVEQSFAVDFYMANVYAEPELQLSSSESGLPLQASHISALEAGFGIIKLEFTNKRDLETLFEERLGWVEPPPILQPFKSNISFYNESYNWIEITGRYSGLFSAQLDLANFPFDTQILQIGLEPLLHTDERAVFVNFDPKQNFVSRMSPLLEWENRTLAKNSFQYRYDLFNLNFSRHTWEIELERVPTYYINKIATGIILIILMTHGLFVLNVSDTNRVVGSMASFFGVVSYLFVISTDTPKVAYTTRMDQFVNLAFFNCFADWFVGIVMYKIQDAATSAKEKAEKAAETAQREERRRKKEPSPTPYQAVTAVMKISEGDDVPYTPTTANEDPPQKIVKSSSNSTSGEHTEEDKPEVVEGWWDKWEEKRRSVDLVVATLLFLEYGIACPLIFYGPE